ncbi:unnamed protein product [Macrosiphum euphorbiae]|uniref:Uncharacterized protein n=1 Tax=Macrosiphum euphorbiae TaxID=13131 RepID=A0AAV0XDZ3_9HEMI|nr:unnamed protein product [Macrosiphum euphorbiae]
MTSSASLNEMDLDEAKLSVNNITLNSSTVGHAVEGAITDLKVLAEPSVVCVVLQDVVTTEPVVVVKTVKAALSGYYLRGTI